MSRIYLRGHAQRAEADDGPIPFIVATEGRKADGLDLQMDRLDLERYRANPVIMYGHDYYGRGALPIGRAENVRVDGGQLLADAVFDRDDEFAATVDRKYRAGFLNAVSVGFDLRGLNLETGVPDSWEMLEFSAVPIPLDPDAVADLGRQVAVARALAEGREGKKLSKASKDAISQAVEALSALLHEAEPDGKHDDEPRGLRRPVARMRLEQMLREYAS